MNIELIYVLIAIAVGLGATIVMDFCAIFALTLVLLASPQWLREPTVLPAMILGLATLAIPFFVMQPSFGLGIAASKTPNPTQARLRSLMNHAVFGLGLYISALAISFVLKAY